MKSEFTCKLAGKALTLRDSSPEQRFDIRSLSAFVGGTPAQAEETAPEIEIVTRKEFLPGEFKLLCLKDRSVVFLPENGGFRILLDPEKAKDAVSISSQSIFWRDCMIWTLYAGVLRNNPILPLHGAVLKLNDGSGVVLCGQSGMGKSTTASRWRDAGGKVLCDDMMLLEKTEQGLVVHPLPTWSRTLESRDGEAVNFAETVPVREVIALSRSMDGTERLEVAGRILYYSAVYSACCFFFLHFVKSLPEPEQKKLRLTASSWADTLAASYKQVLYADLKADIRKTFAAYL